jgi:phage terminase large subunit
MRIRLPHKFEPRVYQYPILSAMTSAEEGGGGYKRGVAVWHRRAGKDKTFFNLMVNKAWERIGNYYYYFPTAKLGYQVIWIGKDRDGFPFLGHIPPEIIARKREDIMRIEMINGSGIQIIGTDNLDVVGPNPVGCIFSEYSKQDPAAWDYVRPILAENDGWALFNYTPRGMNHGYRLFKMAELNPNWFCQLLTVDDTHAIPLEAIEEDRASGMSEEMIQQEYYCSWTLGLEGAYFARFLARAHAEGRICDLPWDPNMGVETAWDIGLDDSTTIWFFQRHNLWIDFIDYYEMSNEGMDHYINVLKVKAQEIGYDYIAHYLPHDINQREWTLPDRRIDTAKKRGVTFTAMPRPKTKEDSIESARAIFPRCRFDRTKCQRGLDALNNYQKEWNEKYEVFNQRPLRNWATHGADAFQSAAIAVEIHSGATGTEITAEKARQLYEQYAPPPPASM